VRERPFDLLAAQALQSAAATTPHVPAIATVRRLTTRRLPFPLRDFARFGCGI
jgi:hypothetical protein